MKQNILKLICGIGVICAFASCENGDIDFPDYEKGTTVYFPYQSPVRTLVMGEDEYDTTLDNAHKCQIQATMGGAYNGRNITIQVEVDNRLCDNLYFEDGTPVMPMPEAYYSLASNTMKFNGGMRGAIEVQLTDAFFNDPLALRNTYVIPVYMKSQTGADNILTGKTIIDGENAQRTNSDRWDVVPKDYVLYCVKYICKYDANYLRRGVDDISVGGNKTHIVRHKGVEKDEVKGDISTINLHSILYPVTINVDGQTLTCNLRLTFDDNDNCTISSATDGVVASGSGSYQEKSEKKAWNNKDRDGLYLDYQIDFGNDVKCSTRDTLVWQSRGVVTEEFSFEYKE